MSTPDQIREWHRPAYTDDRYGLGLPHLECGCGWRLQILPSTTEIHAEQAVAVHVADMIARYSSRFEITPEFVQRFI